MGVLPVSRTLGDLLDEMAARHPGREAVVWKDARLTYQGFRDRTEQLARAFLRLGVGRGASVGVLLGNRPEWLLAAFAAAKIGAIAVGLSTWSRPRELDHLLRHADVEVLVTQDQLLAHEYMGILYQLCPELASAEPGKLRFARYPRLRAVICCGGRDFPGAFRFEDVMALGAAGPAAAVAEAQRAVRPQDPCFILYTSGSTAEPKGVVLPHDATILNGFHTGERQHLTEEDRLWLVISLFWGFGGQNGLPAILTHGGCVVLQEAFDPGEALALIERERCTAFYGLPHMARAMLQDPASRRRDRRWLRTGASLGSPEDIRMMVKDLGVAGLGNLYGCTEMFGSICQNDAMDPLAVKMHTQGLPLPNTAICIVDPETARLLPPGEVGEICVRSYSRGWPCYYKDEAQSRAAFDGHGSYRSGDLGALDQDGRMRFWARRKDVIKTAGLNVSPLEVEHILLAHPGVRAAQVVGVPDAELGEVPVAVIDLEGEPGGEATTAATEAGLRRHCRDQLSAFKVPVCFLFGSAAALPRTPTGKVDRRRLRDEVARAISGGAPNIPSPHEGGRERG
jgi:fatty-acyl-CoA synthase